MIFRLPPIAIAIAIADPRLAMLPLKRANAISGSQNDHLSKASNAIRHTSEIGPSFSKEAKLIRLLGTPASHTFLLCSKLFPKTMEMASIKAEP